MIKKIAPTPDGFYWEEWRGGTRIQSGWHNGSTLSGKDAEETFCSIRLTSDPAKSSGLTRSIKAERR